MNLQSLDLDGNPRLVAIAIDLGPFESSQISGPQLSDIYLPSPSSGEISLPLWAPDTSFFNNGAGLAFNFSAPSGSLSFNSLPTVDLDGTLRLTVPPGSTGTSSFTVTVSDPSQILPDFPPVTFDIFLGDQIYVDSSAAGGNNGSSWNDAFLTLQDAITIASPTQQIWVAQGTYFPDNGNSRIDNDQNSTFQLRNDIAIYGGFAGSESLLSERVHSDHPTILSGDLAQNDGPDFENNSENAYHILTGNNTNSTAVLDGFTITGGTAISPFSDDDFGGGLFNFNGSPTIENCFFLRNISENRGGAIYNRNDSSPSLSNCSFQDNHSERSGGAIGNSSSSPSLTHCSFLGNSADASGGAIDSILSSSPTFTDCSFERNSAGEDGGAINFDPLVSGPNTSSLSLINCSFISNSAGDDGGAFYNAFSSSSLMNCFFQSNSANDLGGALCNDALSSASLTDCSFSDNTANFGGAIYSFNSSHSFTNCSIRGNSANSGGAIYNSSSSPSFVNCSFTSNSATGFGGTILNSSSSPTLINSILWNNSASGRTLSTSASVQNLTSGFSSTPSAPTYSHCLVANSGGSDAWNPELGIDLGNNIDSDPIFVNANGGDLRLLSGSPALDAGDNSVNAGALDLAGNDRIQNGIIDLGALEGAFVTFSHLGYSNPTADDNNNGLSNFTDYALGGDPTAPNDASLQPELIGNLLAFSVRNNAADVDPLFKVSTTLLSDDWEDLILGTDYTLSNEMINGSQVVQTLELSEALLNNDRLFFRQEFSEPAP